MNPQLAVAPVVFAYPLLLAAAPLLALLFLIIRRTRRAVSIPSADLGRGFPPTLRLRVRAPLLALLSIVIIAALTLVLARPERTAAVESVKKRRNLLLAIDVSRSMSAVDLAGNTKQYSRMTAVKSVVRKFIEARVDDRIGVVAFGSEAFVQAPLTLDHAVLIELLSQLDVGVAGDGTAIGDGLGLSLKRLKEIPSSSAAIILVTDGVSNSGQLEPLAVADLAKAAGIKVHTIGVGSGQGVIQNGMGFFQGAGQTAEFDEPTLKSIAEKTGGVYFNARSVEGLSKVYQQIDDLERTAKNDPREEIVDELFPAIAGWGLLAYLLYLLIARIWLLKVP